MRVEGSVEYIPCLYEGLFSSKQRGKKARNVARKARKETGKGKAKKATSYWKRRVILALFLYAALIVCYHVLVGVSGEYINNTQPYDFSVFFVASLVFWPFIIIYNSELYYCICNDLCELMNKTSKRLHWYTESAREYLNLTWKEKPGAGRIVGILLFGYIIGTYFMKLYAPETVPLLAETSIGLIAGPIIYFVIAVFAEKNKNLLMIRAVVCGGLSYYIYITEFADQTIPKLFDADYVCGNVIVVFFVCVVFFIIGTTVRPMYGFFKTFFGSGFDERLKYPMGAIAESLEKIQGIKRYFLHLTGVNLLAYFQLLGCAYFLGIFNNDSIITKILFVIGSFFPVAMNLASSVFFKDLCRKIYVRQVNDIDQRICSVLKGGEKLDTVQTLIATKEMYANEFEVHVKLGKEILVVMLTPVVTAIATIFSFPGFGE